MTDTEIKKLYETLGITQELPEKSRTGYYDTHTPFKKCGITIHVPITIGNSTTIAIPRVVQKEVS